MTNLILGSQTFDTWQSRLEQWSHERPEHVALRFLERGERDAQTLNYAQLWQAANGLAQVLRAEAPLGSRWLLLFEPGLDFCVAVWACLLAGHVLVPLYPPMDPRTSARFMALAKDAQAVGVLTTQAIHKQITVARWFHPTLRKLRWLKVDHIKCPPPHRLSSVPHDALALLQYTSGSTGQARGVMLSHHNLRQNMVCLEEARNCPQPFESEVFLSWLPLYHDMGLMSGVIYPLVLGAESTLFSPLHFLQKPLRWLKAIAQHRATLSSAPNFAYELCLRRLKERDLDDLDLSSWRLALNGAEAVRPQTLQAFAERLAPTGLQAHVFYPCYGLAESTVFVCGGIPESPVKVSAFSQAALLQHRVAAPTSQADRRELVALGRPWGDTELCIVNPETTAACEPEQVGEIWLRGGSIGQGYWQQDSSAFAARYLKQTDEIPWLRTGDLGFVFEGQLFLTGRRKDLIILHGHNYAPQHFEEIAEQAHVDFRPGCCAAFGAGDPESLVIVQEIRRESQSSLEDLESELRKAVAIHFQVPLYDCVLVQAGSLPKTSSGKLQRSLCKAAYEQGKLKRWKP